MQTRGEGKEGARQGGARRLLRAGPALRVFLGRGSPRSATTRRQSVPAATCPVPCCSRARARSTSKRSSVTSSLTHPHAAQLREFLVERHPAQEILDARVAPTTTPLRRSGPVEVRDRLVECADADLVADAPP